MLLISLIGEQPMPVLIPLWAFEEIDATCFVSTELTQNTSNLLSVFVNKDKDLRDRIKVFPGFHIAPYDLIKSQNMLEINIRKLISQYQGQVWLNVTGGTKIMSIASMLCASNLNLSMIYVTTETEQIIKIDTKGMKSYVESFKVNISVRQYFEAHGIETCLNQSFRNCDEPIEEPRKDGDDLEEYIHNKLIDKMHYFDDVVRGLHIRKPIISETDQPVSTELDICVIRNGRLAVCSCKSGRYLPRYLDRLNALTARDNFGIYCGKVFAMSDESSINPYRIEEFEQSKVRLVYGKSLVSIADILLQETGFKRGQKIGLLERIYRFFNRVFRR